jgi:hypothetical protein
VPENWNANRMIPVGSPVDKASPSSSRHPTKCSVPFSWTAPLGWSRTTEKSSVYQHPTSPPSIVKVPSEVFGAHAPQIRGLVARDAGVCRTCGHSASSGDQHGRRDREERD